ncbi:MXAN_6577-like cysteine-rich protein [Anaeromyxobacter oryzisoli]|uniref:MXAN_6577-like cysteine-rich protein n=1 Tax=Anaeromyxobacter oryzisoli TaxID=2925408 RepID=UPI001F5629F0|nr:MXAN_6577-like cysteine-rich protein [Anaeromyxobacter sp. SG63]
MRNIRWTWTAIAAAALSLAACSKKELVCPSDQKVCAGTCTAVATDAANCGACGQACAAGEVCSAGFCRCPDGRVDCNGSCVDVRSDPANCGACGTTCAAGDFCTTSATGATSCAGSCAVAEQTACGFACVDLQADAWNCGACGRTCGTNEHCKTGLCVADLYLSCLNTSEVREATGDLAPAGTPISVASGPIGLAWLNGGLYVASGTGAETISEVLFDPPAPRVAFASPIPGSAAQPDLEYLTAHDGLLWVAHTSFSSLLVLEPDGSTLDELPLVAAGATNPNVQGIAFRGTKAYVALADTSEVVVVDVSGVAACAAGTAQPPCMTITKRIDVSALASQNSLARPARFVLASGPAFAKERLFVSLWNLDAYWSAPAGSTGRLAVIDPATDALDDTVTSAGVAGLVDLGASCLDVADLALQGTTLWATCGAFDYSNWPTVKISGAGIVPVDLSGAAPVVKAILPAAENAAPGALAFCAGTGYVADRNSGRVFKLDPVAGAVSGATLCPAANDYAYVADLACGP